MKRLKIVSFFAFFIAFYLPLSAASSRSPQSAAKQPAGKVMGTLLDVNEARIAHAKVKVESGKFKWEGESDEAGDFTVKLPAGVYRIYVQAAGFRPFESAFLRVKPKVTEMINIHLEVASMNNPIPVQNR